METTYENNNKLSWKKKLGIVAGATAVAACTAGAGYGLYLRAEEDQRNYEVRNSLEEPISQDGFKMVSVTKGNTYVFLNEEDHTGTAHTDIQVSPNCTLTNVGVTFTYEDRHAVDVTKYEFYTYPQAHEEDYFDTRVKRWVTEEVKGQPVIHTFKNKQDLDQNILRTNTSIC